MKNGRNNLNTRVELLVISNDGIQYSKCTRIYSKMRILKFTTCYVLYLNISNFENPWHSGIMNHSRVKNHSDECNWLNTILCKFEIH